MDTANGDDTMVTLWNPADEAQNLVFTLFFAGGAYRYPVPLGPRATRTFNVSEIIQNQLPDENGNTIPAGVRDGSAEIAGVLAEQEHILIAMAAGTYNVRKATCAGYTGVDEFDLIELLGAGQTTSATYSLLIKRMIDNGVFEGHDQKVIGRLGDAGAVLIAKVLADRDLTSNTIDNALVVIEEVFADPRFVEAASDRPPRTALLLLKYFDISTKDTELKKRIADRRKYVLDRYNASLQATKQ